MTSAIEARLSTLSDDARQLVHVASLLVPDCTPALLGEVAGLEPAALRDALTEAVEQGVLVEDGTAAFAFANPLYAHIAYDDVAPGERLAIHAATASALLERRDRGGPVSTRSIAHHLTRAKDRADPALVMEYGRSAGDEALAIGAWAEAAADYEAALAAASGDTEPQQLAALHRLAGLGQRGNLELARAVAHFDAAIACLGPDAGDDVLTDLQTWRIRCAIGSHELLDIVRDRRPLEDLVAKIEESNPTLAAEAMVELSQSYWVDWQIEESERAVRRALALASASGNHEAYARAATSLTVPQWARYDLAESLISLEDGAAVGSLMEHSASLPVSPAFRVPLVLAWLGRLDDAAQRAAECCAQAERFNQPLEQGIPLAALALVALARGEFDAAEQHAHRALLVQRLTGYHWAAGLFLPALFSACLARGRYDAAREALDTWSETADEMGRMTIALLRRYADALERGLPVQGGSLPRLPRLPMVGADSWAVAEIEIARREGAEVNLRRAHELLREMERRGGVVAGGLGVLLPRARGVAADLLGDDESAVAKLHDAIDVARELRAEPEHARALVDLAAIELRRGSRLEAGALLEDAIDRFDRMGMGPDAERARRLSGRATARGRGQKQPSGPAVTSASSVILFSDIVESTRLTEELGAIRYRALARRIEETVTTCVAAHGGAIVEGINLGDGFIGLFPTAEGAIAAAQQCAREAGSTGLHLHLALHAGEIVVDGRRIYGSPINLAARLCGLTGPDEVLVSDVIRARAEGVPGVGFVDRGEHSLKGFADPQRLYALVEAPH
jgi:class 3 adenylate cyclase